MVKAICLLIFLFFEFIIGNWAYAQYPIRGGFTINDNKYTLLWEVHWDYISFQAMAKGSGYVGFGISPTGKGMDGSDLFISGVFANGTVYGHDGNGGAQMDEMNNYRLLYVGEDPMYTVVHFQRLLNTGDSKQDIAIMNEPQYIMWSIGPAGDMLETHGVENRGFVLVNLLNPPIFHSYYRTDKKAAASEAKEMLKSQDTVEMLTPMEIKESTPIK